MVEKRWIKFGSWDIAELANARGFEVSPTKLSLRPFKIFATSEEYLKLKEEVVQDGNNNR